MTTLSNWFSPDVMRPLGWALVHFLWEGLALAALLSAAMALCRSARVRYALAVGTLALMMAAPLATFIVMRGADTSGAAAVMNTAVPTGEAAQNAAALVPAGAPALAAGHSVQPDAPLWFVEAWLVGVLFLSLRNVGGLLLIERLRRKESKAVSAMLLEKCQALQRRLGLDRVIRYCECQRLEAPAVIGWFRPVVLLPVTALTGLSEDQLAAVIAHELAHIQRLDSFVNLFQVAVETLLFYHPAVWWVSKRIRAERENCCDDAALSVCGDAVNYARALTLMAERRVAPSLAMALNQSPLEARVMRLLGMGNFRSGIRTAGFTAGFLCLAGALFAGNAFLGTVHNNFDSTAVSELATQAAVNSGAPVSAAPQRTSASRAAVQAATTTAAPATAIAPPPQSEPAASSPESQENAAQQTQNETQNSKESYIESMKAAGLGNLTVDQIIALKVQGVTAEYVRGMIALNVKATVDEIIAMKVQGITPEYVMGVHDLGFKPDADGLVGMKVQGVTSEYIREMRASGVDGNADEFVAMKVQGITPEYVKAVHDLGWKPDADGLIALKVQGVTPEYIRDMRANGLDGDVDAFVAMKVQGITPEYVKGLHDLGFKPDADEIVGMKVQGVTPEYIRAIRAAGLNPNEDEIVGMKVQGVTPEYIRSLQAAGLKDMKADDYIAAKVQRITPEFIEEAHKHGFQGLDLEKLIALKHAGVF